MTTCERCGATPSVCSSSSGVGLSTESAGFLLDLSGTDPLCIRCAHDECTSRVRTIVAVPGGVVRCLERYCE